MRALRKLLSTIFLTLFGLGIGLAVGAIIMRRMDKAAARFEPENLAASAERAFSDLRGRFRSAVDAGRDAAAHREAELRREFNVPTTSQALGLDRLRRER